MNELPYAPSTSTLVVLGIAFLGGVSIAFAIDFVRTCARRAQDHHIPSEHLIDAHIARLAA